MRLGHCAAMCAAFSALATAVITAGQPPAGLTHDDWSQIRRSIGRGRGSLAHEAQLFGHPDPGPPDAQLGYPASVFGDTAVVPGGPAPGAAYVFSRSGTTWTEHAKLVAPDGGAGDGFGQAVSLCGDTVAVGAPFDATPDGADAGSAHVFRGSVPVELQSFTVE